MKRWIPIVMVLLVLVLASVSDACPMCKDSIPDTDAERAVAVPSGFNFSVYYMLISVFAVMGLVATVVIKGIRSTPVNASVKRSVHMPPGQNSQ